MSALQAITGRRVAFVGLACSLLALAAAVAAGALRRAPDVQLLRHPILATEVALPLRGSRLLLGGQLQHDRAGLAVLRPDGSLDKRFGKHGLTILPGSSGSYFYPEEFGNPVAIDQKGRILFVEPRDGAIRRLLPNGQADRSFGSDGMAKVGFGDQRADVTSVAVQADGKVLVGGGSGCSQAGCSETPAIARLTDRGSSDLSFGDNGHEILSGSYRGEEPRLMALSVGPNGEIFTIGGGYASSLTIQRFSPKGRLDRGFGRRGSTIVGQAGPARSALFTVPKIAVTPSGKLVIGGHVERHGGADAMVAFRYLPNGNPDPSYGQNGHAVLATSVNAFTSAVAVRPDGGVILFGDGVGKNIRYFLLAALRPDGRPDSVVGRSGFAKVKVTSKSSATALVLQGETAIGLGYTAMPHTETRRTVLARIPLTR